MATTDESVLAPHGRDEFGVPRAPHGLKVDGNPRKSARGARPGQSGNGNSRARARTTTQDRTKNTGSDAERKTALLGLADMFILNGLVGMSLARPVVARIGQQQADALAADALVVNHFAPAIADQLILLSEDRPWLLGWLDGVEDKAPLLGIGMVGYQMVKALMGNHFAPDPRMAAAGRTL